MITELLIFQMTVGALVGAVIGHYIANVAISRRKETLENKIDRAWFDLVSKYNLYEKHGFHWCPAPVNTTLKKIQEYEKLLKNGTTPHEWINLRRVIKHYEYPPPSGKTYD